MSRANRYATFVFMVTVQDAFTRAEEYARELLGLIFLPRLNKTPLPKY
jgi:hypothetical protein